MASVTSLTPGSWRASRAGSGYRRRRSFKQAGERGGNHLNLGTARHHPPCPL